MGRYATLILLLGLAISFTGCEETEQQRQAREQQEQRQRDAEQDERLRETQRQIDRMLANDAGEPPAAPQIVTPPVVAAPPPAIEEAEEEPTEMIPLPPKDTYVRDVPTHSGQDGLFVLGEDRI